MRTYVKVGDINIVIKTDRSCLFLIYLLVLRHIGQRKVFYGNPYKKTEHH